MLVLGRAAGPHVRHTVAGAVDVALGEGVRYELVVKSALHTERQLVLDVNRECMSGDGTYEKQSRPSRRNGSTMSEQSRVVTWEAKLNTCESSKLQAGDEATRQREGRLCV